MEFRQLRYFVTVAQELHFGRAAQRLDITQPALSKQIRVLENKIGVQLLLRSQRQVVLTPAGEVFLSRAQQLLEQAEEAIAITKRTALGEVGCLTIGFTATATYTVLPKLISNFRLKLPSSRNQDVRAFDRSTSSSSQSRKNRLRIFASAN